MMKRGLLLLIALMSIFAATTVAKKLRQPYELTGKVYCDTCRFGFETNVTFYISGKHLLSMLRPLSLSFHLLHLLFHSRLHHFRPFFFW